MEKTKQVQVGMGQRSLAQETWRRFKRNRLAIAGMVFIGVLLAISVITVILDLVNPELYNDLVVKNDLLNKLAEPSPEHILGCDEYGRDLLFRILWGTRYSLFAGVVTILAAILVGGTIGSIAGYYGKIVDNCIILGRAEMFASKNGIVDSALDGIGMGIGYTLTVVLMASIREILGSGTWLGFQVLPESMAKMSIMTQAPGAFFCYGVLMAGCVWLEGKLDARIERKSCCDLDNLKKEAE